MASLTGNLISSTYQSVLKIGTNNTASANLNNVTDGAGNTTSLYVAAAATAVSGTFAVLGSMTVSGILAATASYAANANLLDGLDSTVFATTGSNTLKGNQIVSGSIIPGGLAYDLGSLQNPWKEIYVSTGSVNFTQNGVVVSTLNATADSFNVSSNITVGDGGFEIGRGKGVNVDTSVILGAQTMTLATGTAYSIGIGYQTMNKLVNGVSNIAIGQSAGANLVNGNYNVLVGNLAGRYLSEQIAGIIPTDNTYVGSAAGANHTTGSQNAGFGAYALYGNVATRTTNKLDNNTAIGRAAGNKIDGVSANNIYIGAFSGPSTFTQESYKLYVGNGDVGAQPFMYGNMTGSRSLDINAVLTVSGSVTLTPQGAPSTPASGTIYFSSADTHFYGWNGSSWKQLDN